VKKLFYEGKWRLLDERLGAVGAKCDPPSDQERAAIEADRERARNAVVETSPNGLPFNQSCPYCGDRQTAKQVALKCRICDLDFVAPGAMPGGGVVRPPRPPPGCKEYKVLTQRDEFFASKFNPEALQDALNSHAAQGWGVVSMTTTDVGSFVGSFWGKGGGASRQELVILLERTVEGAEKKSGVLTRGPGEGGP
jgi:hypothetical protein